MMQPVWEKEQRENVMARMGDKEALLVLTKSPPASCPLAQELITKSDKALCKTHHYVRCHSGFYGDKKTPYLVVEWLLDGKDALERRWLLGFVFARLKMLFDVERVSCYLPAKALPLFFVMAEDFYFMHAGSDFEGHDYKGFRIFYDAKASLPRWPKRFSHQLGYRKWINDEPDTLTSIEIGKRLQAFASSHNVSYEVLDREELEKQGLNLLLAVGQASEKSPSRLMVLRHLVGEKDRPLTLIGKGITFDTGGINVKPFESHVNCMRNDMGGAALMAHLFMALVASGYGGPLALIIPACENLVAQNAMKPGAIVKSHSGKKVYIEHTDAEGRLILADAISYADKHLRPSKMMVAATLTTASLRQFTGYQTPVYFSEASFRERLSKAGEAWGEKFGFWDGFLPFEVANKTKAADLTNMGRLPQAASIGGGSAVAAHFLRSFTTTPLVHFDIFASCWNWSGDYPGARYGATGAPFNSLFDAVMASHQ